MTKRICNGRVQLRRVRSASAHLLCAEVVVVPVGQRVDEAAREVHGAHLVDGRRSHRSAHRLRLRVRSARRVCTRSQLALRARARVRARGGRRRGGRRACRLLSGRHQSEGERRWRFGLTRTSETRGFGGGVGRVLISGRRVGSGRLLFATAHPRVLRQTLQQRVDSRHGAAHEVAELSGLTRERRQRRKARLETRAGRILGVFNFYRFHRLLRGTILGLYFVGRLGRLVRR